jgi:sRNA-binding carbon storage regulator CsrA
MKLSIDNGNIKPENIKTNLKKWITGILLDIKSDEIIVKTDDGDKSFYLKGNLSDEENLEIGNEFKFLVSGKNELTKIEKIEVENVENGKYNKAPENDAKVLTKSLLTDLKKMNYGSILDSKGRENEIIDLAKNLGFEFSKDEIIQVKNATKFISDTIDDNISIEYVKLPSNQVELTFNTNNNVEISEMSELKENVFSQSADNLELGSTKIAESEKIELVELDKNFKLELESIKQDLSKPQEKLNLYGLILKKLKLPLSLENFRALIQLDESSFLHELLSENSKDNDFQRVELKSIIDIITKIGIAKGESQSVIQLLFGNKMNNLQSYTDLKEELSKAIVKRKESLESKIEGLEDKEESRISDKFDKILKIKSTLEANLNISVIPINIEDKISGQLYYRKNKFKNIRDQHTVLLDLNTENLGKIKILCYQNDSSLTIRFIGEEKKIINYIKSMQKKLMSLLNDTIYENLKIEYAISKNESALKNLLEVTKLEGVDFRV